MNKLYAHSLGFFKRRIVGHVLWNHAYFITCLVLIFTNVNLKVLSAQQSNVAVDEYGNSSSSSILNATTPNGRIGGSQYTGNIQATHGENSRFPSGGVVYGNAGNIIGVDKMPNSRFISSSTFQHKQNFDLLAFRNQLYKAREEALANYRKSQTARDNEPRLVTANAPQRFPYDTNRKVQYGRRAEDQLQERNFISNNSIPQDFSQHERVESVDPAQRIWMRGQTPQSNFMTQGLPSAAGLLDYSQEINLNQFSADSGASRLGGSMRTSEGEGGAWSFPRIRTPEEVKQAFIESLEGQLLRSPEVNPLSPIQIEYQNGVATVRGVVPTPSSRVAAGKILLSDPRVERVNNLLTFVRNDETSSLNVQSAPQHSDDYAPSTNIPK